MKDLQKMMREAQKMAAEMQKAQAELAEVEFEGSAGGGAVKAIATGDGRLVGVTIDPNMFDGAPDPDDVEMLGDTVTAAVNAALGKARDAQEEAMGPLNAMGGGLGLPGM
jgi:DNA-binding YbaB/EbfC family protein